MPRDPRHTDDDAGAGPTASEDVDRLLGWKAIAAYLGRDIRTVQRWESSEQLPVHRLEHQRQGSAYAFKSELDGWRKRRSLDPVPLSEASRTPAGAEPRRPAAAIAALVVVVLATVVAVAVWVTGSRGAGVTVPGEDTENAQAYAAFAEGKALYAARQYREAIVALERAVARDANYGSAWALLAKTHARLAQPVWAGGAAASASAAESARRAAVLAPKSSDTHLALALAARARGDLAAWRGESQRAIDLDPRAAEAYALLGDSYASVVYACNRDQDPERAESYYRKALELAPDLTTAISNRAGNLRRMGRYRECIALLDKAVRTFRDEPPLRATRGACRLMQGDLAGATEDIEYLRGNPKIAPAGALVYLGFLDLKQGERARGVAELEEAVRTSPSSRSDLIVAEVYANVGDIPRAIEHMKKAFAADPGCAGMVDTSLSFRGVRNAPEVRELLAAYGIR
jgi:tetratricopeptide (TPR) repeat protein